MSVGLVVNKTSIDSTIGSLALQARQWAQAVTQFAVGAGALTDAQLIGMGYTQTEVDQLRAAAAPMITAKNTLVLAANVTAMNAVTGIS